MASEGQAEAAVTQVAQGAVLANREWSRAHSGSGQAH